MRTLQWQRKEQRRRQARLVLILLIVLAIIFFGWLLWRRPHRPTSNQPTKTDNGSAQNTFTVFVSPGGGGSEPDVVYPATGEPQVKSKDINLQIGLAIQRALAKEGVTVILSRDTDTFVDAIDRKNKAEEVKASLAIAIYLSNDDQDPAMAGVEIIDYKKVDWPDNYKQRQAFATELEKALLDRLHSYGVASTGIFGRNSAFVPDMPTLVLEPGFISNDIERQRLLTESYQWEIANAVTDAVIVYRDQLANKQETPAGLNPEKIIDRIHVPF